MSVPLQVITSQRDGATIAALVGSASMFEVDAMSRVLDRIAAGHPKKLVLDFSKLEFMASLALGQIVALNRSVKMHGGSLAIAGASEEILGVLSRSNMQALMPIVATVDEALAV